MRTALKTFFIIAVLIFLFASVQFIRAGNNVLTPVVGGPVRIDHVNQLSIALKEALVPRTDKGLVKENEGSLGSSTVKWKRKHAVGDLGPGNVLMKMDYNAAVSGKCGQGFMLMDGRQITEANYNLEHGANSWSKYIITSVLEDKYLPNMTGRYAVTTDKTTQDGSKAITTFGTKTAKLEHDHDCTTHAHVTVRTTATGDHVKIFNHVGTETTIAIDDHGWAVGTLFPTSRTSSGHYNWDLQHSSPHHTYWATKSAIKAGGGTPVRTNTKLGDVDVEPEAIGVMYCMRII